MNSKAIKIGLVSLSLLGFNLASCGTTATSSSTSTATSYAGATISLKTASKTIEVGNDATIRATVSTTDNNKTCNFTVDDATVVSLPDVSTGLASIKVHALKAGTAIVTATSVANPNVTKTIEFTVIAAKPSLKEALTNIGRLTNYTITGGNVTDGAVSDPTTITKITEKAITTVDYDGKAFWTDGVSKTNNRYGEAISTDTAGRAVYLDKSNGSYVTTDATLVKSSKGFLTQSDFLGMGTDTSTPNDVGLFFGLNAVNPNWVTDEKSSDNTYEITGTTEDQNSAFVESMLWQLSDLNSYEKALSSMSEALFTSIADLVVTTVTVTGANSISVSITDAKENIYGFEVGAIGETVQDDDVNTAVASIKGAAPALAADLQKGVTAVKTNNYIQNCVTYPDHKTEVTYHSYYTPKYVFNYYDDAFVAKYNNCTTNYWSKASGGYYKGTDGIYSFTINNPKYDTDGNVTTAASIATKTKVDGTTASYDLIKTATYLSSLDCISGDSVYSFSDTAAAIWSGYSTKYHATSSVSVFWEIANYYAPEDYVDTDTAKFHMEKAQTGIGVTFKEDGSIDAVDFTVGSYPFINDDGTDGTSWGVNRFSVSDFGKASDNVADSLLTSLLAA